ncbi:hypothetical protein F2P81_019478 [Scophthalmus maximus]|uniref:Ferric-chelate reductase 1 n=1 Tax=Scophthalmus maximus TaxID=52904 RepID=A0A6A4SBC6_SCOMX|nr:hypothetical protein F2P81_019478 [Scophthalmus maximus]
MCRLFVLLVALTGRVDPVDGYSNGKVAVACGDMVPRHGYDPSPDPPPYSISVDRSTFSPGDKITVSLRGVTSFKGFLIEARDAEKLDSPAVGLFLLTEPHQSQLLQCGDTPFSAVGCGRSKSCLRDPAGCEPESDPRCFFLSFAADGEAGRRSAMFELSGPADGYVSFALSLDEWMGNDDVYLCVSDGRRVAISAGHVSGRTHPELAAEVNSGDALVDVTATLVTCKQMQQQQQQQYVVMKGAGAHPYVGCTVMALSVIQPIMALLRPVPDSPRRIIFRWLHFGAGTACQVLAGNSSSDDKENILMAQLESRQHGEICKVKKVVLVVFLIGNTAFLAAFIKAIASL